MLADTEDGRQSCQAFPVYQAVRRALGCWALAWRRALFCLFADTEDGKKSCQVFWWTRWCGARHWRGSVCAPWVAPELQENGDGSGKFAGTASRYRSRDWHDGMQALRACLNCAPATKALQEILLTSKHGRRAAILGGQGGVAAPAGARHRGRLALLQLRAGGGGRAGHAAGAHARQRCRPRMGALRAAGCAPRTCAPRWPGCVAPASRCSGLAAAAALFRWHPRAVATPLVWASCALQDAQVRIPWWSHPGARLLSCVTDEMFPKCSCRAIIRLQTSGSEIWSVMTLWAPTQHDDAGLSTPANAVPADISELRIAVWCLSRLASVQSVPAAGVGADRALLLPVQVPRVPGAPSLLRTPGKLWAQASASAWTCWDASVYATLHAGTLACRNPTPAMAPRWPSWRSPPARCQQCAPCKPVAHGWHAGGHHGDHHRHDVPAHSHRAQLGHQRLHVHERLLLLRHDHDVQRAHRDDHRGALLLPTPSTLCIIASRVMICLPPPSFLELFRRAITQVLQCKWPAEVQYAFARRSLHHLGVASACFAEHC